MINPEQIEVGDIVNVYFTTSLAIFDALVKHVPCATGDSWRLVSSLAWDDPNAIRHVHYVCLFDRMDLVRKGEAT